MQQMTQTHDLERAAAQREHEKALQQQQTALEMLQGHMQVGAVGGAACNGQRRKWNGADRRLTETHPCSQRLPLTDRDTLADRDSPLLTETHPY